MAVLREYEQPLAQDSFLIDLAQQHNPAYVKLQKLNAPLEQRERALTGLIKDGLAMVEDAGVRLPS